MKTILINISDPKQKGFSLVSMMVATGLLSALTLGFMEFMRGSLKGQQKLMEVREVGDLKNEMGILLDSESHCRNSIAGPGEFGNPDNDKRLVFRKTAIDTEGSKELELWTSKQNRNERAEKMFYAGKEYGTLTIESIKLFMDQDTTGGGDYEPSDGHEDIGTLKVVTKTLDDTEQNFDIKLSVFMKTDTEGQSTLLSCSRESSARRCGDNQKWTPNCGCVSEGEEYTRAIEGQEDEDFTCGDTNIIFYYDDFANEQPFGRHSFCAISQIHNNNPCDDGPHANCQVIYSDGTWKGIKDGAKFKSEDDCHTVKCSAVCFGGSSDCPPPKKFSEGECKSCDPPKKWYGNICRDCGNRGFSYRCNRCMSACPPRPYSPCAVSSRWNHKTCSCVDVRCPAEEGGR